MFWHSKTGAPVVAMRAVQADKPALVVVLEGEAIGLVIEGGPLENQAGINVDDTLEIAVTLSEPQNNNNTAPRPGAIHVLDGAKEDERCFALGLTSTGTGPGLLLKLSGRARGHIIGSNGQGRPVGALNVVERRAKVI